ncbi:DDE-type integrase/transposase/recombinase [Paeniglutamicibacter psychrophenolicus]|uniref:Transposase n=1 Tax=Paeniglutamicibacter psychrophenolicus TaxID=257454 RepID=A0ABS4WIM1_9MICC|nr:DDE-type integrase/transposase/recombinase [Paeniglutamicibacter psychrophenolicus]MBP2376036.1 putative transposase [Paeniglutamicibacter psychrophenolicus]
MSSASAHLPHEPDPAPPTPPVALVPTFEDHSLPEAGPRVSPVPTNPAPRAGTPLMRKEHREKIALFRYQLIRGAADPSLSTRQRGPMVRALADLDHPWPFGGTRRYSRETLDRWVKAWQLRGFDGLKPDERASTPVTDSTVLALAESLKREKPNRTAAQVKRIITETMGQAPSETTLLRHFRSRNISTGVRPVATGRFEAEHSNEIWVGDALHGPKINGRKTYLFAFLDDHSRMITAARWAYAEDAIRLSAVLRPAFETYGIPKNCYLDNGAAMIDKSLERTCAKLGIRLIHSAPYRPQGRGKIERIFNTVTSQFLGEITVTDTPMLPGTDPATGSQISSLEELNTLFTAWVNMVYHHQQHTTTGQTPLARWDASWEHREPVRKSLEEIRAAFLWSDTRTVTKTGTVSLHSNTYEVDPLLAGTKVELVYDPFDLDGDIAVNNHQGLPAGTAKALDIGRHVHAKVLNAVKDQDPATLITTGINYLDLVSTRHLESLTGAPISFADTPTPDTQNPTPGSTPEIPETTPETEDQP